MKKVFLILLVFTITGTRAACHEIYVRGKITDAENGKALPFANIMLLDHNRGTTADMAGNFSIIIPGGQCSDTLVFSYMGYQTNRVCVCDIGKDEIQLQA